MAKLKQISAKIDAVTLEKIDDIAAKNWWWSRNMILNQIMTAVMDGADMDSLQRMINYDRLSSSKLMVTFLSDVDS